VDTEHILTTHGENDRQQTDNESAKMKTSYGVIQGYDGVTAVDGKHQIIVHAEAFGEAQEHDLLKPMVEGACANFQAIGKGGNIFEATKLAADSGFHAEENMKMRAAKNVTLIGPIFQSGFFYRLVMLED